MESLNIVWKEISWVSDGTKRLINQESAKELEYMKKYLKTIIVFLNSDLKYYWYQDDEFDAYISWYVQLDYNNLSFYIKLLNLFREAYKHFKIDDLIIVEWSFENNDVYYWDDWVYFATWEQIEEQEKIEEKMILQIHLSLNKIEIWVIWYIQ